MVDNYWYSKGKLHQRIIERSVLSTIFDTNNWIFFYVCYRKMSGDQDLNNVSSNNTSAGSQLEVSTNHNVRKVSHAFLFVYFMLIGVKRIENISE